MLALSGPEVLRQDWQHDLLLLRELALLAPVLLLQGEQNDFPRLRELALSGLTFPQEDREYTVRVLSASAR